VSVESLQYFTGNTRPAEDTVPAVRGQGIYFWDEHGKRYMDFASQTLNLVLGQCYPAIVEAVLEQTRTLTYASSRFGTSAYFKAVSKLREIAPPGFTHIWRRSR